ncbi:MAG TPA: hypothetical protein VFV83_04860 [Chthoniobacteraceae bacterium]|nr:hypothetical protein [Chthoniobacteraceae bacterium]
MRDLDSSIGAWRRDLAASGLRDEELLAELEGHLRDEIAHQISTGSTPAEAFAFAAAQIGQPRLLHGEFAKLGALYVTQQKARQALRILAGIPHPHVNNPAMNLSSASANLEPAWATYFKHGIFAGPAILFWSASTVFVLPKLEQICRDAGLTSDLSLWKATHSNFTAMILFREYGLYCVAGVLVAFALLEWRFEKWPRYRRAALGVGAFLLNLAVLLSIFVMIITATAAAPALLHHAR